MQKTRFLALLLVVSMVVSMVVLPAYAESDYTMTLTADRATVTPGGTVKLTLATTGTNPGVITAGAVIKYPAGWTLTNVSDTAGSVFTGVTLLPDHSDNGAGTYTMYWMMNGVSTATGTLATLTFTVPADAATRDYAFTLENGVELNQTGTLENGNLVVGSLRDVDIAFTGCAVTVTTETVVPTTCKTHGAVAEWTPWDGTAALEDGKHYYLTGDVTLTERHNIEVIDVCIDLCGNTITSPNGGQVFRLIGKSAGAAGGSLTLMSSAAGGTIQGQGTYMDGHGGLLYIGGQNYFYCYDITVTGGTVGKAPASKESTTQCVGGNVYVQYRGNAYFENCTIANGSVGSATRALGGNIMTDGILTLVNCEVKDGTAWRGGNIAAREPNRAEVTLIDTTVNYGTAGLAATSAMYIMDGAVVNICGNSSISRSRLGHNDGTDYTATVNMYSGYISQFYVATGANFNMYGGRVNYLDGSATANVYNGYVGSYKEAAAPTAAACAQVNTITGESTAQIIWHGAGTCATCGHTFAAPGSTLKCATCDAVHESMQGAALPWDGSNITSGNYKLTGDLTADVTEISGTLDLNGHTLTVSGNLDASVGNIIDSKGTGKLVCENVLFNKAENEMLPITVDGGYVFETAPIRKGFRGGYTPGATSARYAFYIDKPADQTQVNEALAAGTLVLEVYVKWDNGTSIQSKNFQLSSKLVADYAQNENWDAMMLALDLTMAEGVTILTCDARVTSNGVTLG